ncbi:MAG: NAD(P)H-hydrate dehydratase [Candidatus Saccharimonadaceae bacterium]
MKILSAESIREIDAKTIEYKQILSYELMELAANAFFYYFIQKYNGLKRSIYIFCGTGNNGGDGLAVSRLMHEMGYNVKVFVLKISDSFSTDCELNLDRAKKAGVNTLIINSVKDIPSFGDNQIIIDAIFGTGLSRELSDLVKDVIININQNINSVVSIDVPSGLFLNKKTELAVKATETITFQIPKLALYLPDNASFVGQLSIVDIGLSAKAINDAMTDTYLINFENMLSELKPLLKFAHKGTFGHALIIGGSEGKIGAISLASRAALKSGCGLVSAFVPQCGLIPLQSYLPEAMVIQDAHQSHISSVSHNILPNAVAIGMGMGKHKETQEALHQFLQDNELPIIIDADALNILSENKDWLYSLKANTILTPHPLELSRLIGKWEDDFEKIRLTRSFALKYHIIVVLKGAHTLIVDSTDVYVNSSGTTALATAGSGDVLSGIIAGLLAQGYKPLIAAQLGVYIHGMTANVTASEINARSFIATDIIDNIGKVYNTMKYNDEN